jgi:hypothetical protein
MRTIVTLSALGLTLALSAAAIANPVERSALLERTGYATDQLQKHYRHKRYYRHDQNRARGQGHLQDRRDRTGAGTARPEVRKTTLRPEPAVWREPVVRERPQVL